MNGSSALDTRPSTLDTRPSSRRPSHVFTPTEDAAIRRTYENGTGQGKGRRRVIAALALRLRIPGWTIQRRAVEIRAYQPRVKEAPWSAQELHLLEINARWSNRVIQCKLKTNGYTRSAAAVAVKICRLGFRGQQVKGSALAVAQCFGVDPSTVTDAWIRRGLLKATKRGTARTSAQGGDEWVIADADIKAFIVDHVGIIDLRKVDKYWFVALLTGRYIE
jgi:hypothetical protein